MNPNPDIKVSIIIPTYNREEVLCQTIELALKQDYSSYEVIVVDQTGKHSSSTEKYMEQSKGRVRYLKLDRPNTPTARNLGVREAKGEIVVFLDDDTVFESDLLKKHVANYADPQIGGVAGQVIGPGEQIRHEEKVGYFTSLGICSCNYFSDQRTRVHSTMGCNMSFRRNLIFDAGGFDPEFVGNCHREESDFCFRLRKLGYGIIFDPQAQVVHLVTPIGGSRSKDPSSRRSEIFFRNETLFYLKNMPHKYWFLAIPAQYRHHVITKSSLTGGTIFTRTVNFFRGIWLGIKVYRKCRGRSSDPPE